MIVACCFKTRPAYAQIYTCVCEQKGEITFGSSVAGLKFLSTVHEIHKHRAARGDLRDEDEPRGAADERTGPAKQHKKRDLV